MIASSDTVNYIPHYLEEKIYAWRHYMSTCENTIEEVDLRESLKCPHCNTDLKNRRYLDFLEFLMANGIVKT